MVFALIEPSFAVMVHGANAPTDDEWSEWAGALADGRIKTLLAETAGGGPTARQRNLVAPALSDGKVRVAILSSSAIVRGILTAFNWLGVSNAKCFGVQDLNDALVYLERPNDQLVTAKTLSALRGQLARVGSVAS